MHKNLSELSLLDMTKLHSKRAVVANDGELVLDNYDIIVVDGYEEMKLEYGVYHRFSMLIEDGYYCFAMGNAAGHVFLLREGKV